VLNAFNAVVSTVFDILLAPFGHRFAAFDLVVWPVLAGVVALLVYKKVSNQAGITRAKNGITQHLLEVVLFRDDLVAVLSSTARALGQNVLYVGHNILPMIVMFVPMMAMLVQLVSNYALSPLPVGEPVVIEAKLDRETTQLEATEVTLDLPEGVVLEAPPVRTPSGEIAWRVRADQPGDYVLTIHAGSETLEKGLAVGGDPRKVPVMRTKSWEAFLYPGEAGMPASSAFYSVDLRYPDRSLAVFPDGEGGILLWFFVASLVAGFALKDYFGVTL
jgi:hypothetical protein